MSELTELALIPEETALQVFTTDGAIQPYLDRIREAVSGQVFDLSTKKGRDAVASLAYKVAQSKTYLEGVRKRLADEQKEIPKRIDATGRMVKETLDALRDEIRKPLTEWEAEQARIEREAKERAEHIQNVIKSFVPVDSYLLTATSEELQSSIDYLNSFDIQEEDYDDKADEAIQVRTKALEDLQAALVKRKQYEDEQAELAELRRQNAIREEQDRIARIAQDAAARAKSDAEAAAAESLRLAEENAQRAEREAREAAERGARLLRESEERERNAAERERNRIESERVQAEKDAQSRAADRDHRAKINACALEALIASVPSLTVDQAKEVITAIVRDVVPAVRISY